MAFDRFTARKVRSLLIHDSPVWSYQMIGAGSTRQAVHAPRHGVIQLRLPGGILPLADFFSRNWKFRLEDHRRLIAIL